MTVRIPGVEVALGRPLDASSAEVIVRAVDSGLAEFSQLDWKATLYPHENEGRAELSKDICAMANHIGGAVVIGVEEDADRRPTAAPGVVVDDDELQWMRSVVASWVSPFPYYDLVIAPIADSDRSFLLVLVPPSPAAPHAVVKSGQKRLLYPVRDGTQTRYLSEAELANAYRQRFLGLDDRHRRLDTVTADGISRMDDGSLLLGVTLVPLVPGRGQVSSAAVWDLNEWLTGCTRRPGFNGEHALEGLRVAPGLDRFVLAHPDRGLITDDGRYRFSYGELHIDGSGVVIREILQRSEGNEDDSDPAEGFSISDIDLVTKTVDLLRVLVGFAVERTGASGPVEARISLSTNGEGRSRVVRLANSASQFRTAYLGPRALPLPISVDRTLDLTAMGLSVSACLVGARLLAQGIIQAAGYPELRQIDSDGRLRRRHADRYGDMVRFAEANGIELTDETVG